MTASKNDWDKLSKALHGRLYLPADGSLYDQARRTFNARMNARPAGVACCTSTADVVTCVEFCTHTGVAATCRCGAHGALGYSSLDAELVIDLSALQSVDLDLRAQTIDVGGGARWGQVDIATYPRGYASPGGGCPTVGVGGLTQGGGLGPIARSYGLTIDNLVEAEIVTARDRKPIIVSEHEEPELFWALRGGGGGNFGAVTRFKFRTYPIDPALTAGMVIYKWDDAKRVFQFYRDWMRSSTADDRLTMLPIIGFGPQGDPVALLSIFFNGPWQEGYEHVKKLFADHGMPEPLNESLGPITLPSFTATEASTAWPGLAQIWKSGFLKNDFGDDAIDTLLDWFDRAPKPANLKLRPAATHPKSPDLTFAFIESFGGRIRDRRPEDTAFFWRESLFSFTFIAIYELGDPDMARKMEEWATGFRNAMTPHFSGGVYVNYLQDDLPDWRHAYYGTNYDRLRRVKETYDPDRLFRFPQDLLA